VVRRHRGKRNVANRQSATGARGVEPVHAVASLSLRRRLASSCSGRCSRHHRREALYADMGHFGRFPIRLAWFALVLPLSSSIFGQGALILGDKTAIENPFFRMVRVGFVPLVLLSTAATVIASQAVISGAFSLSRQRSNSADAATRSVPDLDPCARQIYIHRSIGYC